jgi:putative membrane protein
MMGSGFGMDGFGMGLGLLFWIFVFLALYYVLTEKDKTERRVSSPSDILNKRYARGEITRDEYLQVKKEI